MKILFQSIDWSKIEKTEHKGETGTALWQTLQLGGLRIRLVEYSPNYLANHWCEMGHFVHCLEGDFETELKSAGKVRLRKNESYVVSDGQSSHRSWSENGVLLLIVDGDFLK